MPKLWSGSRKYSQRTRDFAIEKGTSRGRAQKGKPLKEQRIPRQ
jgi:hypothetical protein